MTAETYIAHVSLTTGRVRRSPRSEVGAEVLALLDGVLGEALAGGELALPAHVQPASTLTATQEGRCLIATVWAPPEDEQRVPLATMGVATHSRCGARLWESLHAHAADWPPIATRADQQPGPPWCAARLEFGIGLHPHAVRWLGDLERCIAWAWMERRRREH